VPADRSHRPDRLRESGLENLDLVRVFNVVGFPYVYFFMRGIHVAHYPTKVSPCSKAITTSQEHRQDKSGLPRKKNRAHNPIFDPCRTSRGQTHRSCPSGGVHSSAHALTPIALIWTLPDTSSSLPLAHGPPAPSCTLSRACYLVSASSFAPPPFSSPSSPIAI
jgi:hypothetical protein